MDEQALSNSDTFSDDPLANHDIDQDTSLSGLQNISQSPKANLNSLSQADYGLLPQATRMALVQLLRGPYVSEERSPNIWATLLRAEGEIRQRLGDLFLELVVDNDKRIAFIRNMQSDEGEFPRVVRSQPLTLLDTALVLFLREQLLNAEAAGRRVFVGKTDIVDSLSVYRNLIKVDESTFNHRVHASIKKMKNNSVLLPTVEDERYEVSPILRLTFDADQVVAVTNEIRRMIAEGTTGGFADDDDSTSEAFDEAYEEEEGL